MITNRNKQNIRNNDSNIILLRTAVTTKKTSSTKCWIFYMNSSFLLSLIWLMIIEICVIMMTNTITTPIVYGYIVIPTSPSRSYGSISMINDHRTQQHELQLNHPGIVDSHHKTRSMPWPSYLFANKKMTKSSSFLLSTTEENQENNIIANSNAITNNDQSKIKNMNGVSVISPIPVEATTESQPIPIKIATAPVSEAAATTSANEASASPIVKESVTITTKLNDLKQQQEVDEEEDDDDDDEEETNTPTVESKIQQQAIPSSIESKSLLPYTFEMLRNDIVCDEWELDCYSRPVLVENGKKLWEVLITDSANTFRYVHTIPSNQVNSKQLRTIIENLIDNIVLENQKPNVIRFFRGAMFNMISIALSELPVISKPSRCTFVLSNWLEQRHNMIYPNMNGYNKNMIQTLTGTSVTNSFLNVRTPVKLPDALRGEKYAFVGLPLAEFLPITGSVNSDNIGVGKLCPLPLSLLDKNAPPPGDTFVQGLVILSNRATALASWLSSTEMIGIRCDLRKRIVTMETDIDTQYLMAKLNDVQRIEAAIFEEGKDILYGLHFISIQQTENDEIPAGFWLLREPPTMI